jgi:hypothetical protein
VIAIIKFCDRHQGAAARTKHAPRRRVYLQSHTLTHTPFTTEKNRQQTHKYDMTKQ